MGFRRVLANLSNAILRPVGAQLVPYAGTRKPFVPYVGTDKPWDQNFLRWIAEAEAGGKDPNDVGDLDWKDDPLKEALEMHYLPHIHADSVVLELGPGTGRVTRHIISRCREMFLVDYSKVVCDWLAKYLKGNGVFRIYHIDRPSVPMIENKSVDMVLANGVFEHIGTDDLVCFLEEFHRVLKPGGVISFNFDNIMTQEGLAWYKKFRGEPGARCIFRFYHPAAVQKLAEEVGFKVLQLTTGSSRFAHIDMQKPVS